MSKQEEIIEVAGNKVVVRYTKDGHPCEKCVLDGTKGCNSTKCSLLDRVGMEIDERAYFVEAPPPPPLEVTNSLREWAQILATNPDLCAEFDKMCPPQPIQGSIAPEVDLGARMLAHFRKKTKPTWCNIPVKDIIDYLEGVSATKEIDFEEAVYKAFGQVKDFTLAIRIARYFYNLNPKHNK